MLQGTGLLIPALGASGGYVMPAPVTLALRPLGLRNGQAEGEEKAVLTEVRSSSLETRVTQPLPPASSVINEAKLTLCQPLCFTLWGCVPPGCCLKLKTVVHFLLHKPPAASGPIWGWRGDSIPRLPFGCHPHYHELHPELSHILLAGLVFRDLSPNYQDIFRNSNTNS